MRIIDSMINTIKREFPNSTIHIAQEWWCFQSGSRSSHWVLMIQLDHYKNFQTFEFDTFEELVNKVNKITKTKTRILIVNTKAAGKVDPFKGYEPGPHNGFLRGD